MVQIKLFEVNYIDSPSASPATSGKIVEQLQHDVNEFLSTIHDSDLIAVIPLDSSSSKYGIRRNTIIMVVYST